MHAHVSRGLRQLVSTHDVDNFQNMPTRFTVGMFAREAPSLFDLHVTQLKRKQEVLRAVFPSDLQFCLTRLGNSRCCSKLSIVHMGDK